MRAPTSASSPPTPRGVWGTVDAGATAFTDLTPNLAPLNIFRPTSVEFISSNGVDALLVGGLNNIANAQSPIATADSDASGNLANWRAFGVGLPNTIVNQMSYNEHADVLAVSLFGRGAWLLYDVTAYYPSALELRFGLADNDSAPDAAFLTNGSRASRNLVKYGYGTLTVDGTATYSGQTNVVGGRLNVNGDITALERRRGRSGRHPGRHRLRAVDPGGGHAGARQLDRHHHGQRQPRLRSRQHLPGRGRRHDGGPHQRHRHRHPCRHDPGAVRAGECRRAATPSCRPPAASAARSRT